jgi:hypothetical protein
LKARKEKEEGKAGKQTKLDDNFAKMPSTHLKEFTREGVVDAVARFIMLDDQVFPNDRCDVRTLFNPLQPLALASKPAFRNCLVAMKPRAKKTDLPSRHDVEVHISNQFSQHITDLKQRIAVSSASARSFPC